MTPSHKAALACTNACVQGIRCSSRRSSATLLLRRSHPWLRVRVELAGNRLGWVTRKGGKEVRFDSEPKASLSKRIKVRVLSWLPIENLL